MLPPRLPQKSPSNPRGLVRDQSTVSLHLKGALSKGFPFVAAASVVESIGQEQPGQGVIPAFEIRSFRLGRSDGMRRKTPVQPSSWDTTTGMAVPPVGWEAAAGEHGILH